MTIPAQFDPSKLIPGIPGTLGDANVAPAAAQPGDLVDPVYRTKATQAAVKFESFFIGHMLKEMRAGTRELSSEDSVFKNQVNQDMLDMADNLVADQLAGRRAFGVADAILRQLLPAQQAVQQPLQPPVQPPVLPPVPAPAAAATLAASAAPAEDGKQ